MPKKFLHSFIISILQVLNNFSSRPTRFNFTVKSGVRMSIRPVRPANYVRFLASRWIDRIICLISEYKILPGKHTIGNTGMKYDDRSAGLTQAARPGRPRPAVENARRIIYNMGV